jgi:hypothetical protein
LEFDQTLTIANGEEACKIFAGNCPNEECGRVIVLMSFGWWQYYGDEFDVSKTQILYPENSASRQIPYEVPNTIRELFGKAERVLPISPEASAALSRRILQQIFHDYLSIKKKDLNQEIDIFLASPGVPSYLRKSVDGIRAIGNYGTHPIKYQNSNEIVDVEAGEAELSLDTLESLFDFVFVQPKKLEEQLNKINAKNTLAGKPLLKGSLATSA